MDEYDLVSALDEARRWAIKMKAERDEQARLKLHFTERMIAKNEEIARLKEKALTYPELRRDHSAFQDRIERLDGDIARLRELIKAQCPYCAERLWKGKPSPDCPAFHPDGSVK